MVDDSEEGMKQSSTLSLVSTSVDSVGLAGRAKEECDRLCAPIRSIPVVLLALNILCLR